MIRVRRRIRAGIAPHEGDLSRWRERTERQHGRAAGQERRGERQVAGWRSQDRRLPAGRVVAEQHDLSGAAVPFAVVDAHGTGGHAQGGIAGVRAVTGAERIVRRGDPEDEHSSRGPRAVGVGGGRAQRERAQRARPPRGFCRIAGGQAPRDGARGDGPRSDRGDGRNRHLDRAVARAAGSASGRSVRDVDVLRHAVAVQVVLSWDEREAAGDEVDRALLRRRRLGQPVRVQRDGQHGERRGAARRRLGDDNGGDGRRLEVGRHHVHWRVEEGHFRRGLRFHRPVARSGEDVGRIDDAQHRVRAGHQDRAVQGSRGLLQARRRQPERPLADQDGAREQADGPRQEVPVLLRGAGGGRVRRRVAKDDRAQLVGALVGDEEQVAFGQRRDGEAGRSGEVPGRDGSRIRAAGEERGERGQPEEALHCGQLPIVARMVALPGRS